MKLPKKTLTFAVFWLIYAAVAVVHAYVRSASVVDDLKRNAVPFDHWEPFVWEFSSAFIIMALVFGVLSWVRRYRLFGDNWRINLVWHVWGSIIFSVLHVISMVCIRVVVYNLMGKEYDFGSWAGEMWYEYRKDVFTYFTLVLFIELFDFWYDSQTNADKRAKRTVKVKTTNGTYLIQELDIVSIESGGNYVYIHTKEQVLLHRKTMTQMLKELDSEVFLRVHRSFTVNLNMIDGLEDRGKDPCKLILNKTKSVPVSRKYRQSVFQFISEDMS